MPPFLAIFEFLAKRPFLIRGCGGKGHPPVDHRQKKRLGQQRLAAAQGKIIGIEGRAAQIVPPVPGNGGHDVVSGGGAGGTVFWFNWVSAAAMVLDQACMSVPSRVTLTPLAVTMSLAS